MPQIHFFIRVIIMVNKNLQQLWESVYRKWNPLNPQTKTHTHHWDEAKLIDIETWKKRTVMIKVGRYAPPPPHSNAPSPSKYLAHATAYQYLTLWDRTYYIYRVNGSSFPRTLLNVVVIFKHKLDRALDLLGEWIIILDSFI